MQVRREQHGRPTLAGELEAKVIQEFTRDLAGWPTPQLGDESLQ